MGLQLIGSLREFGADGGTIACGSLSDSAALKAAGFALDEADPVGFLSIFTEASNSLDTGRNL